MAKIKGKSKKLFMDDYLFTGSHEEKARKLTYEIDNSSGAKSLHQLCSCTWLQQS